VKHFLHHRMPSPRLPVFLVEVDPPCRDTVKEWRRERWRDWQEANGRSCGANGSHRNLQWRYFSKAQAERRSGNVLMARLELSCSRVERLKAGVYPWSPMAFLEGRT
jgi:hypothetical protein